MCLWTWIRCAVILMQWLVAGSWGYNEDMVEEAKKHCVFIEISNSWWHRNLEGVYKMKNPEQYECTNRTVYKQDRGDNYLYFVQMGSWSGWMIGLHECLNKGYLSVGDFANFADQINTTWEEYNSMRWIINSDLISGCHIPGITRPPRLKTKPPRNATVTSTTQFVTTSLESVTPTAPIPGITLPMLLIPLGCVVILVLIIIICIISITDKSFMERYGKAMTGRKTWNQNATIEQVRFDNRSKRLSGAVLSGDTLDELSLEDQDSVYEMMTEPLDAIIHTEDNHSLCTTDGDRPSTEGSTKL